MAEDIAQRGSEIPYGGAQQLEAAAAATAALGDEVLDEVEDEDLEEPIGAEFLSDEFDEEDLETDEELGGEVPRPNLTGTDALIFGPSLRPDEPVTAGAPFGPGPTGTIRLDDDELVSRALDQMAGRPDAPEEIKALKHKFDLGI